MKQIYLREVSQICKNLSVHVLYLCVHARVHSCMTVRRTPKVVSSLLNWMQYASH